MLKYSNFLFLSPLNITHSQRNPKIHSIQAPIGISARLHAQFREQYLGGPGGGPSYDAMAEGSRVGVRYSRNELAIMEIEQKRRDAKRKVKVTIRVDSQFVSNIIKDCLSPNL